MGFCTTTFMYPLARLIGRQQQLCCITNWIRTRVRADRRSLVSPQQALSALRSFSGGGSDDAVREFSELLVKLNDVDLEFRLLQARPDSEPFVHNVLRVLGQRDDFSSLIGVEGLFARWGLLSSALPVEDLDRLVGQMIVGGTLHSHLQHEPLDTTTAAIATVALRSQEGAGDAVLASWVVERLHGLSAEVWEGALSEGDSITELLLSAWRVAWNSTWKEHLRRHSRSMPRL